MVEEDCKHIIKGVSSNNLRKLIKKNPDDIKPFCKGCKFTPFSDTNKYWICLQCGNIACGDNDGQQGDSFEHARAIDRSDPHVLALSLGAELTKVWCYECRRELNPKSGHLKEIIALVKNSTKKVPPPKALVAPKTKQSSDDVIGIPTPPSMPPLINTPQNDKSDSSFDSSLGQKLNKNKGGKNRNNNIGRNVIPQVNRDRPLGLINLGNTCFMNSTLQCLASTRLLLPKLEIFGSGYGVKLVVMQSEEQATIQLLTEFEKNKTQEVEVRGLSDERGDGDKVKDFDIAHFEKPLCLKIDISPSTMTARMFHTIKSIRKYSTPNNEDSNSQEAGCSSNMYNSFSSSFRPMEVHDLIGKNFKRGAQHDAHELLRSIVDMMKKDQTKAFRIAVMSYYGIENGGTGSDPKLVDLVKALDQKVKHKTFVDEVFGGELMTTQTCLTCKSVKRSHEQFLDLSLPLRVFKHVETPNNSDNNKKFSRTIFDDNRNFVINNTLEDCLRSFTEPELMTGSNVVECENCHRLNLEKIAAGVPVHEVFPSLKVEKNESSGPKSKRPYPPSQNKGKGGNGTVKKEERKLSTSSSSTLLSSDNLANSSYFIPLAPPLHPSPSSDSEDNKMETGLELEGAFGCSSSGTKEVSFSGDGSKNLNPSCELTNCNTLLNDSSPGVLSCSTSSSVNSKKRKLDEVDEEYDDVDMMGESGCSSGFEPSNISKVAENYSSIPLLSSFAQSKDISESLGNLSELKLEEEMGEEGDDDDLPPPVDGIGGDLSDDEDSNSKGPELDLPLTSCIDLISSFCTFEGRGGGGGVDVEIGGGGVYEEEVSPPPLPILPIIEKPTTADEGFSEGSNSVEGDCIPPHEPLSVPPSASSSRNSLSESDEGGGGNGGGGGGVPKVTRNPCSRQQSIFRPPEILTLHLKRFQMSHGGYPTKLNDRVKFPTILDLTPFCSVSEESSEEGGRSSFDTEGQVLYSLYGIVEHSGSMNWGHYVAYVKGTTPTSSNVSGGRDDPVWFHISDSSVSSHSLSSLPSTEPYILFYERIRGETKSRTLSERSLEEDNVNWGAEEGEAPTTTTSNRWRIDDDDDEGGGGGSSGRGGDMWGRSSPSASFVNLGGLTPPEEESPPSFELISQEEAHGGPEWVGEPTSEAQEFKPIPLPSSSDISRFSQMSLVDGFDYGSLTGYPKKEMEEMEEIEAPVTTWNWGETDNGTS